MAAFENEMAESWLPGAERIEENSIPALALSLCRATRHPPTPAGQPVSCCGGIKREVFTACPVFVSTPAELLGLLVGLRGNLQPSGVESGFGDGAGG